MSGQSNLLSGNFNFLFCLSGSDGVRYGVWTTCQTAMALFTLPPPSPTAFKIISLLTLKEDIFQKALLGNIDKMVRR